MEKGVIGVTRTIHETLLHLGVPANLLGFEALTIAIELTLRDPSYMYKGITKRLYPEVAKRISYDATASSVERAMRHAIEAMHDHTDPEVVGEYFGNVMSASKGKLTNSQFIAQVATKLRDRKNAGGQF
jgi:two-component system response regulator (stage 0 sporulation protein A)